MKPYLGCCALAVLALLSFSKGDKELEDVEKFIQEEAIVDSQNNAPAKRSDIQRIPEITTFDDASPSAKPDKISVSIIKEYRVASNGGTEYVSVEETGGDIKASLNPPPINDFIAEQVSSSNLYPQPTFDNQQQSQPENFHEAPEPSEPVPPNFRRKTMDGWLPLVTSAYIGPNSNNSPKQLVKQYKNNFGATHYSKGAYYSPHKEALLESASSVPHFSSPQVQVVPAVPQLNFFAPGQALTEQETHSIMDSVARATEESPNVSQIKAYESTPQISALLRDRFKSNGDSVGHPLNGKAFPTGGVSLRSLAQAIRNGAFSLENDIVPPSASKKPEKLEIVIPHMFKMRDPKVLSGYSNVNSQGVQQDQAEATAASIQQASIYGVPPEPPAQNIFRDYGDSVKYALKEPIQIVETQPATDFVPQGTSSLNQLATELELKLKQLVQQEVLMQTLAQQTLLLQQQQYNAPAQHPATPGQPTPQYGVPGQESGAPLLDLYGSPALPVTPNHGQATHDYEVSQHEESLPLHASYLAPPPLKQKPLSINIDFDTGLWGNPHANVEVDSGDQISHGHGLGVLEGLGQGWGGNIQHVKEEVKDKLVHLGKNLFWSALDFSRKYNPITFIEKVKEFPPVRFEVHEVPKGHKKGKKGRGHKKHGHGKKRRH